MNGIHFAAELPDNVAIDLHPALQNKLLSVRRA